MTTNLLRIIVKKYPNNYELGNVVRTYYDFYEFHKNKYEKSNIDEMFICTVINTEKTFKI